MARNPNVSNGRFRQMRNAAAPVALEYEARLRHVPCSTAPCQLGAHDDCPESGGDHAASVPPPPERTMRIGSTADCAGAAPTAWFH